MKALSRVAPLDSAPRFVVLSPSADHVGVVWQAAYEILLANGSKTHRDAQAAYPSSLMMIADGFLQADELHDWDGTRKPGGLVTDGEVQWALEYTRGVAWGSITFLKASPVHPHDATLSPAQLRLQSGMPGSYASLEWHEEIEGPGCGAIAQDRRFVAAMRDGRFMVFDGNRPVKMPSGKSSAFRTVDVRVNAAPYDMSIVSSGYALLETGSPLDTPHTYTDLERTLVLQARPIEFLRVAPPRWKTIVHHLDLQGKETWHTEVPFEVLQPPIDGSSGRIYLMGMGAAAFQDGKMLFSTPSAVPMLGTAFQDGTLAVAVGPELRIVARDGQIRQRFTTAEHEPITTPPAIGSDGSVWVGTAKGLYVAR